MDASTDADASLRVTACDRVSRGVGGYESRT